MDDNAAIEVTDNVLEVIAGKAAIYENIKRDNRWYYWLNTGERFDMSSRKKQ